MQNTLLGLAIALILALVAALVGPYFVDWNAFRPQFEAEASRIMGQPVRVAGALDARLLPTPSLILRQVSLGVAGDNKVSADRLDVAFSLGSLMRGEWRADDMTVTGLALNLGIDERGRLQGPSSPLFNPSSLTIDKLAVTGKIAFRDAASGKTLNLDNISFSGDVRGASSAVRGEGRFDLAGVSHTFRASSARNDAGGQRLRFSFEGKDSVSTDLDGVLTSDNGAPHFEGVLTSSRSAQLRTDAKGELTRPWQVTGKLTADPAKAKLEQLEVSYGSNDDTAMKLGGSADLTFGARPGVTIALTSRQIDVDRLLVQNDVTATPAQLMPGVRTMLPAIPTPPLPTQLDIAVDTVQLGARPVQGVSVTMHGDDSGWVIGRLAFRPPGAVRTVIDGRIAGRGASAEFAGHFDLEAGDPELLLAWMQGRSVSGIRSSKRLQAKGEVTIGADRLGIAALAADLDGAKLNGGFSVALGPDNHKFQANIVADRFDLDAASAFAKNLAQFDVGFPQENEITLDLGQATVLGQDARQLKAHLVSDASKFVLERLSIADVNGLAFEGSALLDRAALTGRVTVNATAPSWQRATEFLSPFAPATADRLRAVTSEGPTRLGLSLDIGSGSGGAKRSLRGVVDIDSATLKGRIAAEGATELSVDADLDSLLQTNVTLTSSLSSPDAKNLLALLKLDRAITSEGPAQFEASAVGQWPKPFQVKASLTGAGIAGNLQGSVDLSAVQAKGALALTLDRANVAPLFAAPPQAMPPLSLSARLDLGDGKINLGEVAGTWAGARFRGKLVLTPGDVPDVSGDLGVDQIDVPAAFQAVLGARAIKSEEALSRGLIGGWRGRIAFQALNATLPDGVALRPFGGVLVGDGPSLGLTELSATLGGGQMKGSIALKRASDIVTLESRLQMTNVDAAALHHRALAMPPGKISGDVSLAGSGRSVSGLTGSLSGSGSLKLDALKIPKLDPAAFDAAVRASDQGLAVDAERIAPVVDRALSAGSLSVASAQLPFSVSNGRLRIESSALDAQGAQLSLSGGYDIPAAQLDLRAVLSSTTVTGAPDAGRPALQVNLRGTPDGLTRTLDVAALSTWLALRTIDRETKRLEALERGRSPPLPPAPPQAALPSSVQPVVPREPADAPAAPLQPAAPALPQPPETQAELPPLPPPITVRPTPGSMPPQSLPRQKATPRPPLVLTPNLPPAR